MDIIFLIIAFCLGVAFSGGIFFYNWYTDYSDHGGTILIDEKSGVYRIILNNDIEDWGDQNYVILKVSKTEQKLKRLHDINPLELEDSNESK